MLEGPLWSKEIFRVQSIYREAYVLTYKLFTIHMQLIRPYSGEEKEYHIFTCEMIFNSAGLWIEWNEIILSSGHAEMMCLQELILKQTFANGES